MKSNGFLLTPQQNRIVARWEMKKILIPVLALVALLAIVPVLAVKPSEFDENGNVMATVSDNGFNEYGYNYNARIFSGTGSNWCEARNLSATCLGSTYANDKIVMKWNAEWDRGNAENWANPPYSAWTNNHWNGNCANCSDEMWQYMIKWVGPELQNSEYWAEGGYAIWGQFEVLMDQGTYADGTHAFLAHAIPTGYGS